MGGGGFAASTFFALAFFALSASNLIAVGRNVTPAVSSTKRAIVFAAICDRGVRGGPLPLPFGSSSDSEEKSLQ